MTAEIILAVVSDRLSGGENAANQGTTLGLFRPMLDSRPRLRTIAHVETPPTWCKAVGPSGGRLDPYASFSLAC